MVLEQCTKYLWHSCKQKEFGVFAVVFSIGHGFSSVSLRVVLGFWVQPSGLLKTTNGDYSSASLLYNSHSVISFCMILEHSVLTFGSLIHEYAVSSQISNSANSSFLSLFCSPLHVLSMSQTTQRTNLLLWFVCTLNWVAELELLNRSDVF